MTDATDHSRINAAIVNVRADVMDPEKAIVGWVALIDQSIFQAVYVRVWSGHLIINWLIFMFCYRERVWRIKLPMLLFIAVWSPLWTKLFWLLAELISEM
jgi:hypothetical protein